MSFLDPCGLAVHRALVHSFPSLHSREEPNLDMVFFGKVVIYDSVALCGMACIAGAIVGTAPLVVAGVSLVALVIILRITQNSFQFTSPNAAIGKGLSIGSTIYQPNPVLSIGSFNVLYGISPKPFGGAR